MNTRLTAAACLLVLAVVPALSACGSSAPGKAGTAVAAGPSPSGSGQAEISTDVPEINERFPALGTFEKVRWSAKGMGKQGSRVPGPTDFEVQGVVWLPEAKVTELMAGHTWIPQAPDRAIAELDPSVGRPDGWVHSDTFDKKVTEGAYTGRFYFNPEQRTLWLWAVNPPAPGGVVVRPTN